MSERPSPQFVLLVHVPRDSSVGLVLQHRRDHGYEEGEDYEYHELGEEGHGSSDIQQKIRTFEILDAFLERRLYCDEQVRPPR